MPKNIPADLSSAEVESEEPNCDSTRENEDVIRGASDTLSKPPPNVQRTPPPQRGTEKTSFGDDGKVLPYFWEQIC